MIINKDAKEFLKSEIKKGKVYVNIIHPTGELNVYSPIKLAHIPIERSLKHGSKRTS
jgi:hypothetical protein